MLFWVHVLLRSPCTQLAITSSKKGRKEMEVRKREKIWDREERVKKGGEMKEWLEKEREGQGVKEEVKDGRGWEDCEK